MIQFNRIKVIKLSWNYGGESLRKVVTNNEAINSSQHQLSSSDIWLAVVFRAEIENNKGRACLDYVIHTHTVDHFIKNVLHFEIFYHMASLIFT